MCRLAEEWVVGGGLSEGIGFNLGFGKESVTQKSQGGMAQVGERA